MSWLRFIGSNSTIEELSAQHDSRITLLDGGRQLKIEAARATDEARYLCIGTNAGGSADLETRVRIVQPPRIVNASDEKAGASLHRHHSFFCIVDAASAPYEVAWYRLGKRLGEGADDQNGIQVGDWKQADANRAPFEVTEGGQKLHIFDVKTEDVGSYVSRQSAERA